MSKVLFLANHFIALYSFRKELINRLVSDGHTVYLSLPDSEENKYFSDLGCIIIPTDIDRRGTNPVRDIKLIKFYRKMIPSIDPDVIFSYTIKPNIYGTIASRRGGYKHICNITGTGATFLKKDMVSRVAKMLYRISVKKCSKVFFQNTGDRDFFIKNKLVKSNYEMLPGSGCNIDEYRFAEMPKDENVKFIFIGRVMQLKGIDDYLEAAREVKAKYPDTEFIIAGWNEEEKYKKIVEDFQKEGIVNYIGFRKDITEWMAKCHCTVLPSHGGEGVPNVLLESAATGRACIASRINGSSDVVEDGKNGYLFEPRNAKELAEKMERFINLSYEEKAEMGLLGRKKVEAEFDRRIVIEKYIEEIPKADKENAAVSAKG